MIRSYTMMKTGSTTGTVCHQGKRIKPDHGPTPEDHDPRELPLGDRYGRKKMLLISLAIFGAGSVACAYAGSAEAFIAARVIAGLGAAFAIPLSLSTLTVLFSEKERPRAVGVWAAANFLALPVGPIVGGWLLTRYWWGWVFLINVPVVVLGIIALVVLLPESRNPQRPRLDPAGVLTSSAGLAVLTYGIIHAGQHGWGDAVALVAMIAGLLVLVAFGLWEHRLGRQPGSRPLVDMRLFASAGFTWGTVLAAVGMFPMVGVLFTAPQHFQAVLGTDAMGSGVRLLPLIAGVVLGAGGADRIAARAGAKVTVASGFALLAAALLLGATTHMTSGYGFVAAWTALLGTGMGLALATAAGWTCPACRHPPRTRRATASSPRSQLPTSLGWPRCWTPRARRSCMAWTSLRVLLPP